MSQRLPLRHVMAALILVPACSLTSQLTGLLGVTTGATVVANAPPPPAGHATVVHTAPPPPPPRGRMHASAHGNFGAPPPVAGGDMGAPPPVTGGGGTDMGAPPPVTGGGNMQITQTSTTTVTTSSSSSINTGGIGSGGGAPTCEGRFTLGSIPVTCSSCQMGATCDNANAPRNCPDGVYIRWDDGRCNCAPRCSSYGVNEGASCGQGFTCRHIQSTTSTNHITACVADSWNVCLHGQVQAPARRGGLLRD